MGCQFSSILSAYYDGELAAERRAAVEGHLRVCEECRGELATFRRMSQAMAARQGVRVPGELMARLRREAQWAQQQRGVWRLTEVLTGAAAAILVVGLMSLFYRSSQEAGPSSDWERAAVTLRVDAQPADTDAVVLAQWSEGNIATDEER